MRELVINQDKNSNYISHLVYYFTLNYMHACDREYLIEIHYIQLLCLILHIIAALSLSSIRISHSPI